MKVDPKPLGASAGFYPAASLYAVFVLPASILAMSGMLPPVPALASASGHAHELLFGFALAVVAGNQLGVVSRVRLGVLLVLWTVARVAFLFAPTSSVSALANTCFALVLAAQILPRLRVVKKLRNFALPATVAAICICVPVFDLVQLSGEPGALRGVLEVAVLLFASLMLFMGGRLIAPAVAGQLYRQGERLDARVQPRIEGSLIATMLVTVAAIPIPAARSVGALGCIVCGLLAAARALRWRLWACRGRPDLLCLAAGYFWLSAGLLLFGAALQSGFHTTAALHVITIGALGTLTFNVMAFSWMAKAKVDTARERIPIWGTLLLATAVLARLAADFAQPQAVKPFLLAAALCWCGAFLLLLALFWRYRETRPRG